MDFMAIIDSNHKNSHQIKWDTSHWPDTDTDNSPWTEIDNNYTFHATTPPQTPPPAGGVLFCSPTNDGIDVKFVLNSVPTSGG